MCKQTFHHGKTKHSRTCLSATLHNTNLTQNDLRMNECGDVRRHDVHVKFNDNGLMVNIFLGI